MKALMTMDDTLITRFISESIVDFQCYKVRERLIGGAYHVQTIGRPLKYLRIKGHVFSEGKDLIDAVYTQEQDIYLWTEDKKYTGYIMEKPDINYLLKKDGDPVYEVALKLSVELEENL